MKEITIENVMELVSTLGDLNLTENQIETDLQDLGMDSITFIKIIVELEEHFECEIPDSKLLIAEMNTISKMYQVLKAIYTEQTNS